MARKSQMWFMDFVIGMMIFLVMLISYYTYTTNISKEDTAALDDLLSDAETVSLSLTSTGYPSGWTSSNVVRIGFTDNYNRIDNAKFTEFNEINYNKSKKLLGTIYDYFLYFVNESGDVQNVEGYCGTGLGEVNITLDISAAYYNECPNPDNDDPPPCEEFLKDFMEQEFNADVYCEKSQDCPGWDFDNFIGNINNYDFIVVEHPVWTGSQIDDVVEKADPWLTAGGILFVGGELPSPNQYVAFGVKFNKIAGQSESDRLATIVNEDEFIAFDLADNIIFRQAYYIEDVSVGANLKDIARFNGTWVEFDDIRANGDIALARWPRSEGKILFFSDFDANYLQGNFQEILEASAQKWANAICLPVDISNVGRNNLVNIERMVVYKSDLIKMVLYLWS